MRRWNVLLDRRLAAARSAWRVDFQQPFAVAKRARRQGLRRCRWCGPPAWPISRAWFPWKAAPSWTCKSKTDARRVDVGELAAAEYQPGRRLLGVFAFAGAPPPVAIDVTRQRRLSALSGHRRSRPTLLTLVSAGRRLPDGSPLHAAHQGPLLGSRSCPPDAELWSAQLSGRTARPEACR